MNLRFTYQLLTAADEQRHGFIKLRGIQADREVRLMAQAGLVEATLDDGKEGSFTSINRITETGQTFLRTFQKSHHPAAASLGKSSRAVLAPERKANFNLDVVPFRAVA